MIRRTVAGLAITTLLSGSLVGSAQAGGGGHCDTLKLSDRAASTVGMKNSCFTPTVTRVETGGTVTWVNREPFAHTLTAPGDWGSGYKEYLKGDSATFRFDDEGVFPYYCLLHPGMTGVVVVGDGLSSGALSNIEPVEPTQPLRETVAAREAAEVTESSSLPVVALMTGVALTLLILGGFAILRRRSAATAALSR